jgi:hypothetical protein
MPLGSHVHLLLTLLTISQSAGSIYIKSLYCRWKYFYKGNLKGFWNAKYLKILTVDTTSDVIEFQVKHLEL